MQALREPQGEREKVWKFCDGTLPQTISYGPNRANHKDLPPHAHTRTQAGIPGTPLLDPSRPHGGVSISPVHKTQPHREVSH